MEKQHQVSRGKFQIKFWTLLENIQNLHSEFQNGAFSTLNGKTFLENKWERISLKKTSNMLKRRNLHSEISIPNGGFSIMNGQNIMDKNI